MKKQHLFAIFFVSCLGIAVLLPVMYGQARSSIDIQNIQANGLYLPLLMRNAISGKGSIEGKVFNASFQDKPGLGNIRICVKNTSTCTVSSDVAGDARGEYSLKNLSNGSYQLSVQDPNGGFNNIEMTVSVNGGQITTQNFGLVAKLVSGDIEMRITVEWLDSEHWPGSDCLDFGYPSGCPTDLDAHIWGQFTGGDFHHYQCDNPDDPVACKAQLGDCTAGSAMCVELFSFNGPGPETVAIRKPSPGSTYYYAINNFYDGRPGVPNIKNTGAVVRVYRLSGSVTEYFASKAPDTTGRLWYLFSVDDQTNITLQNCITDFPDDPDPNDSIIPPPVCPVK
jgi:hypothetical protein